MINQPMILFITFIFDTFLTNWLPCGIGNYRNNYFFCSVTIIHNKNMCCILVDFFSNKFFPKSKKENGFWTFLKCPFSEIPKKL
jgi:hypothetical protein